MTRRRILRALFILPVLLCLALWFASAMRSFYIHYSANHHMTTLFLCQGVIGTEHFRDIQVPPSYSGWQFESDPPGTIRFFPRDDSAYNYHLGFAWDRKVAGIGGTVPAWFPTLLSAAVLCLVWRKTRPKIIGQGFPVEPDGKESAL
jgi:hypothetical protein